MKRNVNPKTLKGQDKLNRMLDLMGRMNTLNESRSLSELELIKKGPNGIVYGIIRENHDYFIKTSNKTSGEFLSEDFSYIGGLKNKYDERYHSYAEALKHLNIKFDMLNESYGVEKNTNIFESDGIAFGGGVGFGFVMEDEEEEDEEKEVLSDSNDDLEEQKKVLKVDAPKDSAPVETPETPETPVEDEVADDTDSFSMDNLDTDTTDDTDTADMGDMEGEEGDDMTKKIQKYTGKIGQMLRDMDEVDPDLEKYVINSIISALHLDEMDEGDKEDIIAKLEGEEDLEGEDLEDGESTEDTSNVDLDLDTEEPAADEEETPKVESEKKVTKESRLFSKKQLMESLIKKTTKRTLRKPIRESRQICEVCMGEGCSNCMEEHHNMSHTKYGKFDRDEYMIDEDEMVSYKNSGLKNPNKADLNKDRKLSRYERRRGEAVEKSMDSRRTRKRHIDEEDMSAFDAMEMGQGYLSATDDLDRDFDGIPNRLDLDNNDDGRLDFDMNSNRRSDDFIELDIDFLRSNNPVKEPGIKKPTTKPGTGTDWDRIKRPKVNPKPKAEDGMERVRPSYRRRGMFR
jgi:hypothetical protein